MRHYAIFKISPQSRRFCLPLLLSITLIANLIACNDSAQNQQNRATAEKFIDAFYSYEPAPLLKILSNAQSSIPSVAYYQGWAEGGNYTIIMRNDCKFEASQKISCSITVKDDLMRALGINFDVTDTFHLSFNNEVLIKVVNSSNDLQVFHDARDWVTKNRSKLIDKPCRGFFDGGPTPGNCVRAMVHGFAQFTQSKNFPDQYRD